MLGGLTAFQAAAVLAVCALRLSAGVTLALLAAMAFVNGRRSMAASALGMDSAPDDRVAVMSMRAAANQLGYLLGAAAGGLALAVGGFSALGLTLAALFAAAVLIHFPSLVRTPGTRPTGGHRMSPINDLDDLASDLADPAFRDTSYVHIEPRYDTPHEYANGNSQHPLGDVRKAIS
jgi:hypothetical protein